MSLLQTLYHTRDILRMQLRGQQIMCRIAQDKYREALQSERIIQMCEELIQQCDQDIESRWKLLGDDDRLSYNDAETTIPDLWIPDEYLDEIEQKDVKK